MTAPPQTDTYTEWLRYLVQSCEHDDPALEFLASIYSYCIKNDGITEKQKIYVKPYINKAISDLKASCEEY